MNENDVAGLGLRQERERDDVAVAEPAHPGSSVFPDLDEQCR
jgi:hypothetical protein